MELISVKEGAQILGLAEKTVHNRKGGTSSLTRVYIGTSVRLLKHQVIALRDRAIEKAMKRSQFKAAA